MSQNIKELITDVLDKGYLMSLATHDEGGVWVADVIYVFDEQLNIYWISDREVRHSEAILNNNKIAGTVAISGPGESNLGIQFEGIAEKIEGPRYDLAKKHYTKRLKPEPEETEESPARTSFFAKTANKLKERAFEKEQEFPLAKFPESGVEKKDILSSLENTAEEPAEVEGQLTVDIYDDGERIVIQSTVAGVKPEDLDVSITNDMVTIKGRRKKQEEVKDDSYYYRELYWGSFSRSVILPEEIEVEKTEAALKNGLLTVKLPKKNKHIIQKIKVKME